METYLQFVDRWAKAILLVLFSITVFFASQLGNLTNDSNPYLLPETHPARKSILDMQQEFSGTFDAAMIVIHNEKDIFNRTSLDAVYELTQSSRKLMLATQSDADYLDTLANKYGEVNPEFQKLATDILKDGFSQSDFFVADQLLALSKTLSLSQAERAFMEYLPRRLNPIKEMAGLAASDNIITQDGTLKIFKSLHDKIVPAEQIKQEVMGNELMLNSVYSADNKSTMITVELFVKQDDADGQVRAYEAIKHLVDDYRARHPEFTDDVYIAGVPIFIAEQKKLTDSDLATLLPMVLLIVGGILVVFFRRPMGFVLPMLNVVMCTIWTLGMMSLFRVPMDLVTSALPVFLITICGADAIHMMNEYYTQHNSGLTPKEAVKKSLRAMFSPIVLTTVTTVAGFLFSTSTNISSIQSFGIFMAVGLFSAQIISLLLIPAWLNLTRGKSKVDLTKASGRERLGSALETFFGSLIKRRKASLIVFSLFMVGLGFMATKIVVEDAGSDYFSATNEFRKSDEFVNAHIAGTSPGWVEIAGGEPNAILNTETVAFIDKLDQFLLTQENVTYTYSIATYIKRMNLALHDMNPDYNRLPNRTEIVTSIDPETNQEISEQISGDDLISQLVLLYENGGGSDLNNVLTRDFSKAAVLFTMNTTRATEYQTLLNNLDVWLAQNKPANVNIQVAGTPVIWTGVLHEIIKGQLTSFLLAFSSICVVLMLWLRSSKLGLLTALPLAATMVSYYGIMAILGIELNIGTALISFIVVGIVDYSVHYLHRVKDHLAATNASIDESLLYAIRHSGASIVFNVALFSLGFLTLLFSQFKPIAYLGGLVALALTISGFMSIFLISMLAPWFIRREKPPVFDTTYETNIEKAGEYS
ncbi:MAG TPA: transporter [Cellvibrio sp.]|nr:transporter [Cellvibrio sp.]